jgi:glutathione S-transferase
MILYEHPFALYCQKVLIALNELGVEYQVLEEQRDFDRAELAQLWPPASIPVLRDGDQIVGETSIIIEHVGGPRLVPSLEARKWDRLCDQYVSDAVQAIVFDTLMERFDERAVAQARGRLDMVYGMLDAQL